MQPDLSVSVDALQLKMAETAEHEFLGKLLWFKVLYRKIATTAAPIPYAFPELWNSPLSGGISILRHWNWAFVMESLIKI